MHTTFTLLCSFALLAFGMWRFCYLMDALPPQSKPSGQDEIDLAAWLRAIHRQFGWSAILQNIGVAACGTSLFLGPSCWQ